VFGGGNGYFGPEPDSLYGAPVSPSNLAFFPDRPTMAIGFGLLEKNIIIKFVIAQDFTVTPSLIIRLQS
jgi:hypothetical protein